MDQPADLKRGTLCSAQIESCRCKHSAMEGVCAIAVRIAAQARSTSSMLKVFPPTAQQTAIGQMNGMTKV